MSDRGLVLALQRFHDDPGFADRVAEDPQATLGIYDLDERERQMLVNMDDAAKRRLAASLGLDWQADHIAGVGALDDDDERKIKGNVTIDTNPPGNLNKLPPG